MNKILVMILLTIVVNANTVVGKILYAYDEEGVMPVIGLEIDGKEKYFIGSLKLSTKAIDKRKGEMIRAFLDKNNEIIKIKYLKERKIKSSLPFIGAKQTKDGRTKITISKNGNMTIYSHFKNGYKTHFKGKYTKELIPEDSDIPMHAWKVYKNKVCQGYRNAWGCKNIY